MHTIEVRELVVEYKKSFRQPTRAVDGLSFVVNPGEIVGLVGLNGAGKTSTIKTLMGFQPPTSGMVRIGGMPVGDVKARRGIGFLPETALYSPHLTPFETLRLYGELHGLGGHALDDRIGGLLASLGVAHRAHHLNRHLSKGMLQRVGIAQALLGEPQLLILDELSSGLDPLGRRDLRELMRRQRENGVTVLFSSHELSEVEMLCDRVLVIHQGKLVAEERVEALRGRVESLEDYFVDLVSGAALEEARAA
ncbi:MAG: ABC transporter ATP-binding protein [Fimbriimonadia bacterium]|jgi:ABC-2 type transport system ATP-binding protein